jgi:anaerobic selenocysteine-containing dehydrogenase
VLLALRRHRHLRDGKLWKFEGNPKDPQSMGRLCPRGTGAVGAHYDPDRLRQPLMRVGERGKEQWKAVSWDEALTFVAEKMNKIKAEHGAESVACSTTALASASSSMCSRPGASSTTPARPTRSAAAHAMWASC